MKNTILSHNMVYNIILNHGQSFVVGHSFSYSLQNKNDFIVFMVVHVLVNQRSQVRILNSQKILFSLAFILHSCCVGNSLNLYFHYYSLFHFTVHGKIYSCKEEDVLMLLQVTCLVTSLKSGIPYMHQQSGPASHAPEVRYLHSITREHTTNTNPSVLQWFLLNLFVYCNL